MFALSRWFGHCNKLYGFASLTAKTPCGQTLGGLKASLIKSLYCKAENASLKANILPLETIANLMILLFKGLITYASFYILVFCGTSAQKS
jgi:hypothetical protein